MENNKFEDKDKLNIPPDIPDGFFNVVSDILNFIETVDKSDGDKA